MPREPLAATRVPQEYLDRADALTKRMIADPDMLALMGKPSRAAVLRLAIKRGLEALEAEHPAQARSRK